MAEGHTRHWWEDWAWDETVFEGTAAYYRQGREPYAPALADALAEHLHLDGRGSLLDAGCGPGTVALLFAHLFESVIGLDPDPRMLAEAQRAAAEDKSLTRAGSRCEPRISPDPSAPSESSASPSRSTGWTDPGWPCSMPMAPSSKSTSGTLTRRARRPRAGHTHQSPRRPLMSFVVAGSVPTAVPIKGSGTPPPTERTRSSRPPGSLPSSSWSFPTTGSLSVRSRTWWPGFSPPHQPHLTSSEIAKTISSETFVTSC